MTTSIKEIFFFFKKKGIEVHAYVRRSLSMIVGLRRPRRRHGSILLDSAAASAAARVSDG